MPGPTPGARGPRFPSSSERTTLNRRTELGFEPSSPFSGQVKPNS